MLVTYIAIFAPIAGSLFGIYLAFRLQQVHRIVNEHATIADERNAQLVTALKDAGIPVPEPTQKTGPAS